MKLKLAKNIALGALLVSASHAATITISPGIGTNNGLFVTVGGVAVSTNYISIGSWNGTTFTQFGTTQVDTTNNAAGVNTINGAVTATSPTSVNGSVIHLYFSTTSGINTDTSVGNWVIFRTSANTQFPADVSSALASATATFSTFTTAVNVAQSNTYEEIGTRNINFVPEPSATLLGAVGALGLLRRRCI